MDEYEINELEAPDGWRWDGNKWVYITIDGSVVQLDGMLIPPAAQLYATATAVGPMRKDGSREALWEIFVRNSRFAQLFMKHIAETIRPLTSALPSK